MSEKKKRTIVRVEKECQQDWMAQAAKEGKDLIDYLRQRMEMQSLEGLTEVKDNIEAIKKEHPEVIDHETSTEELMSRWETSVKETFTKAQSKKKTDEKHSRKDEEIIFIKKDT